MPIVVIIAAAVILFGLMFAVLAFLVQLWFERQDEKQNHTPGWDEQDTDELQIMHSEAQLERFEAQRERETCPNPNCKGTRCYDWRRNGRSCAENPTEADGKNDYLVGRHDRFAVVRVASNWWPNPKSRYGRTRPDLWKRVAGHCQIALHGPVKTLAAVA